MKTLVSVLTLGVGIQDWDSLGIMQREMALYENYLSKGWRVIIVTTSRRDKSNQKQIKEAFSNFHFIFLGINPLSAYFRLRFSKGIKIFKNGDVVIRSNQLLGAHLMTHLRENKDSRTIRVLRMGFNPISNYQKNGNCFKAFLLKRYLSYVSRRCDALEVSHKSLLEGAEKYIHVNCFEIPNFVDNSLWNFDYRTSHLNLNHQFVYFGRFENEKNLINFIDAIKRANLHGVLIGSGSLENSLRNFVLNCGAKVEIWERISGIELTNVLKDSKFSVLVSRFEGNPKSVLESISAGVPVIVSPLLAFQGIIEDGVNGLITKGFEPEDIYACLMRAVRMTHEEYKAMSENAFRSSSRFGIDYIINKQIAEYYSLLSEK
jgi:glycosyltransferase involved in cell wall biosynthesis